MLYYSLSPLHFPQLIPHLTKTEISVPFLVYFVLEDIFFAIIFTF